MSIFTKNPKQKVEIIRRLEDFPCDGKLKPQVIVRFKDGWEVEWLVEDLVESEEGEIATAMEGK
ncbi:MAG: hypothetical protein GTO16_01270 [Candidatus Aminicenantes bacterium]|nr:hypothetical protein [Candidatus Aminicenantes bacterium]